MTTISTGIDVGWIYQHAKFCDIPFKRFVSKCGETWKCGEQTDGRTIIPINLNGSRISPKWFGHYTQTQAHVQLDGRMNTWNGNNTISINVGWWWDIWIHQHAKSYAIFAKWFVSETARLNICYKMVECTKTWTCDEPTDGQKDVSVDEGIPIPLTTCLGTKWVSNQNFKNEKKRVNFWEGVTLTFNTWPWKVYQFGTLSLPLCVPNLRIIYRVLFELLREPFVRRVAST